MTQDKDFERFAEQYGYGLPIDVCVKFDKKFNPEMKNATLQEKFLPAEMKKFISQAISVAVAARDKEFLEMIGEDDEIYPDYTESNDPPEYIRNVLREELRAKLAERET